MTEKQHTILNGNYACEEQSILYTTHPKITYDELTEVFIVDLGEGAWCEVYGKNRFRHAIKIAKMYE